MAKSEECHWKIDTSGDYYETECDNSFCLIESTPIENGMKFCTYCGKTLKVIEG